MTDRRRINPPAGGTKCPVFSSQLQPLEQQLSRRPRRARNTDEVRKIFLKTGLTPSASGSAYLELALPHSSDKTSLNDRPSSLKLTCTVYGPRPLPRSSPFIPHILLSTHVKFAPFATRKGRGYIRDASERDLAVHLESALRGIIIGDRWPKSGVDVIITVLEGEDERWWEDGALDGVSPASTPGNWGLMSVLAGCITVASAAIADAGLDCVDLVTGGVAALVRQAQSTPRINSTDENFSIVLDPNPTEHTDILAICVVGYLSERDEITELWVKGTIPTGGPIKNLGTNSNKHTLDWMIDGAVEAAARAHTVLADAIKESSKILEGAEAIVSAVGPRATISKDIQMVG